MKVHYGPHAKARAVAVAVVGLLLLLPLPTAGQQRYDLARPPAVRPPLLPGGEAVLPMPRPGAASAACAFSACGLHPGAASAACAFSACGLSQAGSASAACPVLDCGLVPVSRAGAAARRASTYPAVAIWSFAGAIVGAVALAGIGYGLGMAGDAGYDAWLTASDVLGVLGFVVGYPAGGAIGAVIGARRAGLQPHTATVVLVSYLGAAAGVLVGAGVARTIPTDGLPTIVAVTVHLGFTTAAAHESGR
jgi:hypothetical protein